jgi:hypothetical protein
MRSTFSKILEAMQMTRQRKSRYDEGYAAGFADGLDERPSGPSASDYSRMKEVLAKAEARCVLAETRAVAQQYAGLLLLSDSLWEVPVISWQVEGHTASAVTPFGKPTIVVYPNGFIQVNGYLFPNWRRAAQEVLRERAYAHLRPSDRVLSRLGLHASWADYVAARKQADEALQRVEDALYSDAPDA